MKKRLMIIGAGGHGKVIADIASVIGYEKIEFLDDDTSRKECMNYPIIGTSNEFLKHRDADYFVAVGNASVRKNLQEKLENSGISVVTLIHPSTVIASNTEIGNGSVVMAGSVINPDTRIGKGCIINTCASVDHDNRIGDYVHVSVGSHLCGTVTVENGTWIGAGTIVSNNIQICEDCMIGAGAVVIKDIKEPGTYIGVPARRKMP